jgi:tetratricopeptide (TPR) repeat protein
MKKSSRKSINHLLLGREYFEKEDFEKALPHLQKACKLRQNSLVARLYFGACLGKLGHYKESFKLLQELREVAPQNHLVHYFLGIIYKLKGAYKDSIKSLKKALCLKPEFRPALIELGLLYFHKGKFRECIVTLRRSPEYLPLVGMSHISLGVGEGKKGNTRKAVLHIEKAIKFGIPLAADAYSSLGEFYFHKRAFKKSAFYLGRFLKEKPDSPYQLVYLGTSFLQIGHPRKALAPLLRAQHLDPMIE